MPPDTGWRAVATAVRSDSSDHVFVLSIAITSVLSLDATVLLLTPVVVTAAMHAKLSARPPVYAAGHLANSSSLLLPMANLTNLLAIGATGLTLVEFSAP